MNVTPGCFSSDRRPERELGESAAPIETASSPLRLVGPAFLVFALGVPGLFAAAPIDREALVGRHAVVVRQIDPESPLSVGNGDFAFTVDATGLQTFEEHYYQNGIPLETLSTWAWHSFPNPEGLRLEDAMVPYPFHDRTVHYAALQDSPAGAYFRENPHPIPLGQVSLLYKGNPVEPSQLEGIDQRLDLWTGVVHSRYTIEGQPVTVETLAHPDRSLAAFRLQSPLVESGDLTVRFRFPYSHRVSIKNRPPFDWSQPGNHRTVTSRQSSGFRQLERTIDDSRYYVNLWWQGSVRVTEAEPHDFRLRTGTGDVLSVVFEFAEESRGSARLSFEQVRAASAQGWKDYWTKGGVVDLAGSTDPRAAELERRIVLSQYLMKVHYSGSMPPAESGLAHLSWYGKHNSEMYFWHAAQFYQWGHVELLEKGLAWYREILPLGMADAASKGFEGVRWPKMVGIDGRPGPGTINPFIIWNQPNPIYLAELVHRARPGRETLEKYRDVVFESARFLASFAQFDEATSRYVLGPPIKNVSESSAENNTQNPTFELAYWYYALSVAQTWRDRLGLEPDPHWADILARLSRLPVSDGKYVEIETFPNIYQGSGGLPVSMLLTLGFLPQTEWVDPEVVRRTFHEVNRRSRNGIGRWVSWSMGQGAMTAARLGEPETAVGIVTNASPASRFMNSGFVRRAAEPVDCPVYLPVNSSLLAAVGLMAGGWDTAPDIPAPGFPKDGTWIVRSEGLLPMP